MFRMQSTHISVLHKAVLAISVVWNFVVFDSVYADEQSFIYASDVIQGQKNINSEREIWHYQHQIPLTFQDKDSLSQTRYSYPPPTQKIGSNPISNPQHRHLFSLNNKAENHSNVAEKIYNYLPPIQKTGSNPFIKPKNQYVTAQNISQFFASSCHCVQSNYQRVFANY